jgi:hypothetical protein
MTRVTRQAEDCSPAFRVDAYGWFLCIGIGYVPSSASKTGCKTETEIRGRRFAVAIVPKPIYKNLNREGRRVAVPNS